MTWNSNKENVVLAAFHDRDSWCMVLYFHDLTFSYFVESSKQELTSAQEKLERSSRDFKTQIESLKKVHALEKDDVKRQLKEEQEKEIQKG